jgi:hypothetical protein
MIQNYNENMNELVNSYINKKSLCMLLLASSILFYDMAKSHKDNIPNIYALIISILLILYSVLLGIYGGYEFSHQINVIISKCSHEKCSGDIIHLTNVRNFYTCMGVIYSFILLFITYILIRFDKK